MTLLTRGAAGCSAPGVASGTKTSGFGSQPANASNAAAIRAGSSRPHPGEDLIAAVSPGWPAAPGWAGRSARGQAGRLLLAAASAGSGTAAGCQPRQAAPQGPRAAMPMQPAEARPALAGRAAPGADRGWGPGASFRP